MKDTSDKTLLQKVADDIGLAKVAAGWREGIRVVYFKNLSPFVHGALHPTALQLHALTSARCTDSMAACCFVLDVTYSVCNAGEGSGAGPDDGADGSSADSDGSDEHDAVAEDTAAEEAAADTHAPEEAAADTHAPELQGDA